MVHWTSSILHSMYNSVGFEERTIELFLEICTKKKNGPEVIESGMDIINKARENQRITPRGMMFLVKLSCMKRKVEDAIVQVEEILKSVEREEVGGVRLEINLGVVADSTWRVVSQLLRMKKETEVIRAAAIFEESLALFKRLGMREESHLLRLSSKGIVRSSLHWGMWPFVANFLLSKTKEDWVSFDQKSFLDVFFVFLFIEKENLAMSIAQHGSRLGFPCMVGDSTHWDNYIVSLDD